MLPRWHVMYGLIFSLLLWLIVPEIGWLNVLWVFLASFLIDVDHYISSGLNSGKWGLFDSFRYYDAQRIKAIAEKKRGIRKKGDFHLFHTVEFLVLVGIIGIFFRPVFFVFVGMIFHSLFDLYSMGYIDGLYRREFFFYNWIRRKL